VNGADYDGVNDVQLRFCHAYGGDVSKIDAGMPVAWAGRDFWADPSWDRAAAGVRMAVKDTDQGYNVEWRIPVESLHLEPVDGNSMGYETQINDNDSGQRDHISHWWIESGDPSWNNAATWGTAYFRTVWTCGCGKPVRNAVNCLNSVQETEVPIGRSFMLAQNYPNPFNPETRIFYTLKRGGPVRLSVHDVTGREAAVLVNGRQQAGDHLVQFRLQGLASGVYVYRLETDDGVLTRKMSLVR
jgi:hypothetical protein